MLRLILLILVAAGVGGYFTKPDEAAHQRQAEIVFRGLQQAANSNLDLGDMLATGIARLIQEGAYEDLYVASKYTVTVRDKPFIQCYGAYTRVFCSAANPAGGQGEQDGKAE